MKNFLLIIILFYSNLLSSQTIEEFDNSTPQKTVRSHFTYLSPGNYKPEVAAFALGDVHFSPKERNQLIVKLKAILIKHKIVIEEIPDSKRLIFSNNKYVFFEDMPEVYLIRKGKTWVYSKETVLSINKLYSEKIFKTSSFKSVIKKETLKVISSTDTNTVTNVSLFNLSTPYNTIITHILYLEDSLYNPELASRTINFSNKNKETQEELAIKLKQIYLGSKMRVIDFESLTRDSNYIDSLTKRHIYYPNPQIPKLYLEKIGDRWLYSGATSELINAVHKEMFDEDVEQIFALSDKFKLWTGENYSEYVGPFEKWQWLMIIYFVFLFVLIRFLLNIILKIITKQIKSIERYRKVGNRILKNIFLLIYIFYAKAYIPSISLNLDYQHFLHVFVGFVVIYISTVIALSSVTLLRLYLTRESTIDSKHGIIIFLALIIKTIIIVISLLVFIKTLDYNLVNVLAGLSIGGFALALGAQDTIKNFFGSLMIFADHPFSVGDYITDGKMYGTVEEVGLRTTKIRTLHGSVLSIPNSNLSDNNIDNLGKREYRRFKTKIIVEFNTDSEKLNTFVNRIEQAFVNHPHSRKDYYVINLNDFELYGIEILVNVFFIAPDWKQEMQYKHEFIAEIITIAKELEIEFAIPPK